MKRLRGVIKNFNGRGFGFIVGDDGHDYFLHINDLRMGPGRSPTAGEGVSFDGVDGPRGLRAFDAVLDKGL